MGHKWLVKVVIYVLFIFDKNKLNNELRYHNKQKFAFVNFIYIANNIIC